MEISVKHEKNIFTESELNSILNNIFSIENEYNDSYSIGEGVVTIILYILFNGLHSQSVASYCGISFSFILIQIFY